MLFTIRTTHQPATDLGFLLHKNPARVQTFSQSFGNAHVFYPEASAHACTCALLLDVDPVGLVRNRRGPAGEGGSLDQYVNDRPYVASSFMSVAISDVFGSAMAGRSKERPELATAAIPLECRIAVVRSKGGEALLRALFEPLGYTVGVTTHHTRYFTLELAATKQLAELLAHVYVLLPVLDDQKHYWIGRDEVEKLLRIGEGWLATHPQRDEITRRYLGHRRSLVDDAIERLTSEDDPEAEPEVATRRDAAEETLEQAAEPQRAAPQHRARRAQGQRRGARPRPRLRRGAPAQAAARRATVLAGPGDGRVVPRPRDRAGSTQARAYAREAARAHRARPRLAHVPRQPARRLRCGRRAWR